MVKIKVYCSTCKYGRIPFDNLPCRECGSDFNKWESEPDISKRDEQKDNPLSPNYYSRYKIQPLAFISENGLDFLTGNIIKYIMRHDAKNGLEDLKKARVYLNKLIERTEKQNAQ